MGVASDSLRASLQQRRGDLDVQVLRGSVDERYSDLATSSPEQGRIALCALKERGEVKTAIRKILLIILQSSIEDSKQLPIGGHRDLGNNQHNYPKMCP